MLPSRIAVIAVLAGGLALAEVRLQGQVASVLAVGLHFPLKMAALDNGQILVAEAGVGLNGGRISVVDRFGRRGTLLAGLPSGPAPPNGDQSGPGGVLFRGRTVYIAIGAGNTTVNGPAPGSEVANPSPASPLFSSILALDFEPHVLGVRDGFTLPAAAHADLAAGKTVVLTNANGERAFLRMIVNFPDSTPNPRPDVPGNVRPSNPFGLEGSSTHLDVVDASQNLIRRVDISARTESTLAAFAPLANPTPIGPPVIDTVPTSAHGYGDDLVVSFLSGFPFPAGAAGARLVGPHTGKNELLFSGFRMVTDVLPLASSSTTFFVLEFESSPNGTGRLSRVDKPGTPGAVLATGLVTPTNVIIDPSSGDLLVTEYGPGRIVVVSRPR
jgi:hypothetical protein